MSNSGGDEERLSTPSEESVEDETKDHDEHASEVLVTLKNTAPGQKTKSKSSTKMTRSNNSSDRDAVEDSNKLPRRFVQLSEENLVLKRQLKKQEERIKILATKLIRVISERSNKTKREEILLDEQKARIGDLEHEVSVLRDKLQVTKQQLTSYTRLIPHHYHPPPSRQASMLSSSSATSHSKIANKGRSSRNLSGGDSQPPRPSTATSSRGNLLADKHFADRVEELLLEAKAENQALEDQLKNCRQRLSSTEEALEKLKETFKNKEAEHQEELLSLKSQLGKEEDIAKKKKQLSDNIQLIRLQRESRRTASWLSTLEAQNRALEGNLASTTENLQQIENQLSEVQEELSQEQQKNITLQKQMEDATSSLSRLKELEAQISSLQNENKILQETNESLLKNAFSVKEKVEKAESVESHMRIQMAHLETALKAEMRSKADLSETLCAEKEKYMALEVKYEKLQESLTKMNQDMKKRGELCCDTCPNHKKVTQLEKELNEVKDELVKEKSTHEKTVALLKTQAAETEKYQRKVEELTIETRKADEFHCKKLHELVKGLEERKKQITQLEISLDEWKKQQSVCKVCESRDKIVLEAADDETGNNNNRDDHPPKEKALDALESNEMTNESRDVENKSEI